MPHHSFHSIPIHLFTWPCLHATPMPSLLFCLVPAFLTIFLLLFTLFGLLPWGEEKEGEEVVSLLSYSLSPGKGEDPVDSVVVEVVEGGGGAGLSQGSVSPITNKNSSYCLTYNVMPL